MAESMLRIQQVRSAIGRTQDQHATVRSLGLRRIRHTVLQPDRPEIRGMITAVAHLVTYTVVPAGDVEKVRAELAKPATALKGGTPVQKLAKKAAAKRTKDRVAASKAAAKKSKVKESSARKSPAKPAADAEAAAVKAPAKKAPAKKTAAKKPVAKKAPAKKTAAKKPVAKKAPAKKTAAKKKTTAKSED
jgi:ribosomal protein L30